MFTILKPEMRRCIESLDSYLAKAEFKIDSRHSIPNWETTAKSIYAPQLLDPKFTSEFNTYLWMTQNLFGNTAVAYKLSKEGSLEKNIKELMKIKTTFRSDTSKKFDDPINFMINLNKLSIYQPKKIGKEGIIKIGNSSLKEKYFDGRWDYFFFKYIHIPDDIRAYEKENDVLVTSGIYNNQITNNQWKQMVETETLIPSKIKEVYR